MTGKIIGPGNTKYVEIAVHLKYSNNFQRTFQIPLINWETNPILTWSENCVITNYLVVGTFTTADTKIYVPVANLSTQDNEKLLQKSKSGFKNKK